MSCPLMARICLFLFVVCSSLVAHSQSFELTTDNLLQVYGGKIEWTDLDNDNDLDLLYNGFTSGANEYFTMVYENVNGSFTAKTTALPPIRNGSFAVGDYDNDGDMDVLLAGLSTTGNIADLYENTGAFVFTLKYSFPGLINGAASWFDLDNDQDLDFLYTGVDDNAGGGDPFVEKTLVYENSGGAFTLVSVTNLPNCTQCAIDWSDSNGDGKVDLLLMGFNEADKGTSGLYLNNGDKTFQKDENSPLKDLFNGDARWGDFDNDGDMDALLSGIAEGGIIHAVVYENIGTRLQERSDIIISSVGENWKGGTKWVDYDNDGFLDMLVSGRGGSVVELIYNFKVYHNDGEGQFTEVQETNFVGLADCSVDVADYDNDGDIDISFQGSSQNGVLTGIYKNLLTSSPPSPNTNPVAPATNTLSERFFRKQVVLTWKAGSDTQTPTNGLSYNFYLRNATDYVAAPTSDYASGYLRTGNPPNGHGRRAMLNALAEGVTYFWAVQSVDGGKAGSLFSGEKSFYQIHGPECLKAEIIDVNNVTLSWIDNSAIETNYDIAQSTDPISGFTNLATLPANTTSYVNTFAFLTDTYYYYRIAAIDATSASGYDSLKVLIPTAPTSLVALSVNASRINLAWHDNSAYETGYVVERKMSLNGDFETVATLPAGTVAYEDNGLAEGTSYDYRVRATISYGSSDFSNISSAQTNFRPVGEDFEKTLFEDDSLSFTIQDFTDHASDPDTDDVLVLITIKTLPQKGVLQIDGLPVGVGHLILTSQLGTLKYVGSANENGTTGFDFELNDGKDNSAQPYTVTLTITPVNDAPILSVIADVSLVENSETPPIAFAVEDIDNPPSAFILTAVSDNLLLIKNEGVTFQGTSNNRTFRIIPQVNTTGEAHVTITVSDGERSDSQQFMVTVSPVTSILEHVEKSFSVYPNPVTSTLVVTTDGTIDLPYTLVVHDLVGREILRQAVFDEQFTVSFDGISSGAYLLSLGQREGRSRQVKIFKK